MSSYPRVSSAEPRALKRLHSVQSPGIGKHPVQVARRNERERKRVQQVNNGFVTLRNHVPVGMKNKKLSKVETLRQAAAYIEYLQAVLTGANPLPPNPMAQSSEESGYPSPAYASSEPPFYPNYASADFLLNNCSPADLSQFKPSPHSDSSYESYAPDSTTSPTYSSSYPQYQ